MPRTSKFADTPWEDLVKVILGDPAVSQQFNFLLDDVQVVWTWSSFVEYIDGATGVKVSRMPLGPLVICPKGAWREDLSWVTPEQRSAAWEYVRRLKSVWRRVSVHFINYNSEPQPAADRLLPNVSFTCSTLAPVYFDFKYTKLTVRNSRAGWVTWNKFAQWYTLYSTFYAKASRNVTTRYNSPCYDFSLKLYKYPTGPNQVSEQYFPAEWEGVRDPVSVIASEPGSSYEERIPSTFYKFYNKYPHGLPAEAWEDWVVANLGKTARPYAKSFRKYKKSMFDVAFCKLPKKALAAVLEITRHDVPLFFSLVEYYASSYTPRYLNVWTKFALGQVSVADFRRRERVMESQQCYYHVLYFSKHPQLVQDCLFAFAACLKHGPTVAKKAEEIALTPRQGVKWVHDELVRLDNECEKKKLFSRKRTEKPVLIPELYLSFEERLNEAAHHLGATFSLCRYKWEMVEIGIDQHHCFGNYTKYMYKPYGDGGFFLPLKVTYLGEESALGVLHADPWRLLQWYGYRNKVPVGHDDLLPVLHQVFAEFSLRR